MDNTSLCVDCPLENCKFTVILFCSLLFFLFINDLPASVHSKTRHFADGCVIYRKIKNIQDCQLPQQDLHSLAEWEATWGMAFHPDKCNVLRVTKKQVHVRYSYSPKGRQLEEVTTAKYRWSRRVHNQQFPMDQPYRPNSEESQQYSKLPTKESENQQK